MISCVMNALLDHVMVVRLSMGVQGSAIASFAVQLESTMGSKAGSAVVCILCALLLLMQAIVVNSLSEKPELYSRGKS